MASNFKYICLKCSMVLYFMLLLPFCHAQSSDSNLDNWMKDNLKELGGRAVLMVYKDGKIVYNHSENDLTGVQKFFGKRLAKRKGLNPDVVLQDFSDSNQIMIASCSKWLSASLVMTFVDEGKLSLDDTIGKFLPVMTTNGKGQIKIWQCLSHLTGIKAGSLKESLQEMKEINSMDEAMDKIAQLPMEGAPGKTFHYSNVGLQIAGAIIEKISHQSFEALFQERIAKPCEMINSNFGNGKVALPAGSGRSTADDYMNFLTMILHDGIYNGKQILSKQAIVEMQKNRVGKDAMIAYSPAQAQGWGYGFGEWVMDNATRDIRSKGVTSPGLFGSFPWVDYNKHYAAFLLVFNFKNEGRGERYKELKSLVDDFIDKQ